VDDLLSNWAYMVMTSLASELLTHYGKEGAVVGKVLARLRGADLA
jgi:hypothetical protein